MLNYLEIFEFHDVFMFDLLENLNFLEEVFCGEFVEALLGDTFDGNHLSLLALKIKRKEGNRTKVYDSVKKK